MILPVFLLLSEELQCILVNNGGVAGFYRGFDIPGMKVLQKPKP